MTGPRHPALRRPLWITLGLATGPAVALGLGRFAYALVLPAMRADLHWSFATAGALNTANAVGYLLGALLTAPLVRRTGEPRAFVGSIALTALVLLGSAASGAVPVLLALRLVAGASGAVAFIVGGGLTARLGRDSAPHRATLLLGVYFGGAGAGIVASGLLVPGTLTVGGWHSVWLLLGILSAVALLVAAPAAHAVPAAPTTDSRAGRDRVPLHRIVPLLTAYGLFGAGYIAYMTFIVAFLHGVGARNAVVTWFWVVLGMAAVAAGFCWPRILGSLRGGRDTALPLTMVTVGATLPLLPGGLPVALASAVPFGGAFLTVVTAVTLTVRRLLPPAQWTAAIAWLTAAFAAGQCVGPVLSGMLSDGPGGILAGLAIGAALLALSVPVALLQRTSSVPAVDQRGSDVDPLSGTR